MSEVTIDSDAETDETAVAEMRSWCRSHGFSLLPDPLHVSYFDPSHMCNRNCVRCAARRQQELL